MSILDGIIGAVVVLGRIWKRVKETRVYKAKLKLKTEHRAQNEKNEVEEDAYMEKRRIEGGIITQAEASEATWEFSRLRNYTRPTDLERNKKWNT